VTRVGSPHASAALEEIVGHRFADRDLLRKALTHASRAHEEDGGESNERLEFLGDAVLDLVVAESLFASQPTWKEGDLTRARAALVNSASLAAHARELELGRFVRLGRTEQSSTGAQKESILANVFEALVGAIYLDAGLDVARAFVRRVFATALAGGARRVEADPKTRFQEWAHARLRRTPTYRAADDSGIEEDAERFTVEVRVGEEVWGRGRAGTKRAAERAAALAALRRAQMLDA
jgi:ribonuclease-3